MQQSNKAMFLKNSRTRPREFYRFTALMHSSLTQILKSANLPWKFADLSSPIAYRQLPKIKRRPIACGASVHSSHTPRCHEGCRFGRCEGFWWLQSLSEEP